MSARWWTWGVWALAAGSALFWGFKVLVKAPAAPPHTQTAQAATATRGDLSRLLGADAPTPAAAEAPPPAEASRFQLIGVLSPRSSQAAREGLALIAVDGKPAKAFRVGAVVEGQNVLQSVAARGATLGPRGGAALVALNLAPPAPPATGLLPGAGAPGGPLSPPAQPGVGGPRRPNMGGLPTVVGNDPRPGATVPEEDGSTPPEAAPTR